MTDSMQPININVIPGLSSIWHVRFEDWHQTGIYFICIFWTELVSGSLQSCKYSQKWWALNGSQQCVKGLCAPGGKKKNKALMKKFILPPIQTIVPSYHSVVSDEGNQTHWPVRRRILMWYPMCWSSDWSLRGRSDMRWSLSGNWASLLGKE